MHKPDPVETILARLMPSALSEDGQRSIEAMLDDLAGGTVVATAPARPWLRRMLIGGIAASGVAAALVFAGRAPSAMAPQAKAVGEAAPEFVLVGESDRIESRTDEGWQEYADGSAMRAMRLNVVEENSFLDEETGIVMQVSEPREEIFLMPISAF